MKSRLLLTSLLIALLQIPFFASAAHLKGVQLSPWQVFAQSQQPDELRTVPYVEVSRYVGRWYQIARNPLPFEGDCACSQQTLSILQNGNVGVYNSCNDKTPSGVLREIRGFAVNDDPQSNSKFTVDFSLPKKGQYWIIGLDPDYRFAVVSDPSRMSLYVLSKTPQLSGDLYAQALQIAQAQVDTSKLLLTEQQGCQYPQQEGL